MTRDKSLFTNLDNVKYGLATFCDGSKVMIYGKGTISASWIPKLKDVLFVDGLKVNLIITSQICNRDLDKG